MLLTTTVGRHRSPKALTSDRSDRKVTVTDTSVAPSPTFPATSVAEAVSAWVPRPYVQAGTSTSVHVVVATPDPGAGSVAAHPMATCWATV
jgi:hypothetical protein